jgi:hypothetical protein
LLPSTYNPFVSRAGRWKTTRPSFGCRMRDREHCPLLVYRYVARLAVAVWAAILNAIAIYSRKGVTNRNRTGGSDRNRCATWREDDAVKWRVTAVNLRIVGPRISFWHYLMQSIVPYASIRARGDVGTMAEGRLRRKVLCLRFRIDIAIGKGADVLWTGLPLYECSTLARVIGGRARIDPTPSPVGTVCISAAFLRVCTRRRV